MPMKKRNIDFNAQSRGVASWRWGGAGPRGKGGGKVVVFQVRGHSTVEPVLVGSTFVTSIISKYEFDEEVTGTKEEVTCGP